MDLKVRAAALLAAALMLLSACPGTGKPAAAAETMTEPETVCITETEAPPETEPETAAETTAEESTT
ncbi:MAG: hypothetical protein IJT56_10670 [Clostridia bacterium]|nr:hypothetical protein [Clostridia bacterium]